MMVNVFQNAFLINLLSSIPSIWGTLSVSWYLLSTPSDFKQEKKQFCKTKLKQ